MYRSFIDGRNMFRLSQLELWGRDRKRRGPMVGAFGGFGGGAAGGKEVQDQIACSGQKLYEELGELSREAGWVGRGAKSCV
jgi:hypothetical protein